MSNQDKIPLIKPDIHFEDVADDIKAVLDSGMLTSGHYVQELESLVADYIGTQYAVAVSSATAGLHLALMSAGIGPGDEVLVSDFTFPASGNAIIMLGAIPVMVDCIPGRWDMDPDDLSKKITSRSKAVMVIDPVGQAAELHTISQICKDHNLFLVEDAACAIGASRDGKKCGSFDDCGVFSFHPRKVVTTGEGGMVTTNDSDLACRLRTLSQHGGERADIGMNFVMNGVNYRLSEISAVLGIEQMKRLDAIVKDRQASAAQYLERIKDINSVSFPMAVHDHECTFQSFVVLLENHINRDQVHISMKDKGIETTLGTYAMHAHPAFSRFGYKPGDLPHAWNAQNQSLTLPLLPDMDISVIDRVVEALNEAVSHAT